MLYVNLFLFDYLEWASNTYIQVARQLAVNIHPDNLHLPSPLSSLGEHEVPLRLPREIPRPEGRLQWTLNIKIRRKWILFAVALNSQLLRKFSNLLQEQPWAFQVFLRFCNFQCFVWLWVGVIFSFNCDLCFIQESILEYAIQWNLP